MEGYNSQMWLTTKILQELQTNKKNKKQRYPGPTWPPNQGKKSRVEGKAKHIFKFFLYLSTI